MRHRTPRAEYYYRRQERLIRRFKRLFSDEAHFLEREQYEPADAMDLAGLREAARSLGAGATAESWLTTIKATFGGNVKRGHLFWIIRQIEFFVPPEEFPPACVPGQGLVGMMHSSVPLHEAYSNGIPHDLDPFGAVPEDDDERSPADPFFDDRQFLPAPMSFILGLYIFGRQEGVQDFVETSVEAIRKAHGDPIRNGHVNWIGLQIEGTIPSETEAPSFRPGDGFAEYFGWE